MIQSDGRQVELGEGRTDVRLSNLSKSAKFTTATGSIEFKVPAGFPGGNLRNFDLYGRSIGQPTDFHGRTYDRVTHEFEQTEWESCQYWCGNGRVCWGRQLYRSYYRAFEREFVLTFVESVRRETLGQFNGIVERGTVLYSRYPVTSCY